MLKQFILLSISELFASTVRVRVRVRVRIIMVMVIVMVKAVNLRTYLYFLPFINFFFNFTLKKKSGGLMG